MAEAGSREALDGPNVTVRSSAIFLWSYEMRAVLIVPDSAARKAAGIRQRSKLTLTTTRYGMGVLVYHKWDVLDGLHFRILRDSLGAKIETNDPQGVCRALGMPEGETGIEVIP